MFSVANDWNPKQALLKNLLRREEDFDEALSLTLELHAIVHASDMPGHAGVSYEDEVWSRFDDAAFRAMPTKKDVTVAWNIWHITRIEDLAANLLIAHGSQVYSRDWRERIRATADDTGNAMTDEEILSFSQAADLMELKAYRNAVGERTRAVLSGLKPGDLKRKVAKAAIARVREEGCVADHPDALWLLDFWARKNVAGFLSMPITRHQVGHITDSLKLIQKQGF
jgi:hypothetical protein